MPFIKQLIWDEWNVGHFAQHDVVPEEIEQLCHRRSTQHLAYNVRIMLIGQTDAGRMLSVVLALVPVRVYYPLTARPASQRERRIHLAAAGGERNTAEHREQPMKGKEPLPESSSREEEAEFWDTHDLADYWDEFKPVKARFAKDLSEGITLRFDPQTVTKLRSEATSKGVGPTTLARMWVLEHLQANRSA